MTKFKLFDKIQLDELLVTRDGETKLGEKIQLPEETTVLRSVHKSTAKFVVLGIPEDIGVRANKGIGGAQTAWLSFLRSFLNIQQTQFFNGGDFLLLGAFDFSYWENHSQKMALEELRELTEKIDEKVHPVIKDIVMHGKIPIVIGGGHNNALPIIHGASLGIGHSIDAINLDAHADFRHLEGRHSGNGFSWAKSYGYLENYAVLGLHEAYNPQFMLDIFSKSDNLLAIFWEDIFLRDRFKWGTAVERALSFVAKNHFGVELDLDCIENTLSSAATPVGVSAQQAMKYLYKCGQYPKSIYLHLPEGVTQRADGLQDNMTGKLLSYLVQAFVKGVIER